LKRRLSSVGDVDGAGDEERDNDRRSTSCSKSQVGSLEATLHREMWTEMTPLSSMQMSTPCEASIAYNGMFIRIHQLTVASFIIEAFFAGYHPPINSMQFAPNFMPLVPRMSTNMLQS
jgi:hypothetical protein